MIHKPYFGVKNGARPVHIQFWLFAGSRPLDDPIFDVYRTWFDIIHVKWWNYCQICRYLFGVVFTQKVSKQFVRYVVISRERVCYVIFLSWHPLTVLANLIF